MNRSLRSFVPGRRARRWLLAAAALVIVVTAVLIALPYVVRWYAVQRLEAMTGRDVTVADVDLNLLTRRIAFTNLQIAAVGPTPALVTVRLVEARFELLALLRGRANLDQVTIIEPVVHIARTDQGTLDVEDVVEQWHARPAGEPVQATLDRLTIHGGRITFADRAVEPARTWTLADLALEARDISTVSDAATGRLAATFALAGGTGQVAVENLRVRPFAGRAHVTLHGIDITPVGAYLDRDAPIRFAGGTVAADVMVTWQSGGPLDVDGESTLADLVLSRSGQDAPFATVPSATLRVGHLAWREGGFAIADAVFTAPRATVFDASAPRARPLEVRDVEAAFHDSRDPARGPGRLTLAAVLPGNGTLQGHGTGELFPPNGTLTVELRGLDATLAQVWIPADSAVTPTAGQLGATLTLRYAAKPGLRLGGRVWATDLAIARRGQDTPLLRDQRVELTVTDVLADGVRTTFERLRLVASPTIVPGEARDPVLVQELVVTAGRGAFAGPKATPLDARLVLASGGRVTATGTVQPAAPSVTLDVRAQDVDAMLAVPYLPPQAAVTIAGGRLDARLDVAWRDALRVDGQATLRALTVRLRGEDVPIVEHAALTAEVQDLILRDGALSLARVTLTGSPTIVDPTPSPPQRFEMRRLRLTATNVTWPGRAPLRVEAIAETTDGGTATLTGTVDIASRAADARLAFDGLRLTRARGYLPETAPLTVEGGVAQGTITLRYARDTAEIDAEGAVGDLSLTLTAGHVVPIVDDRVTFAVEDLVLEDGRLAVKRVALDGSPALSVAEAPPPVPLQAALHELVWPGGSPARFTIAAQPGQGELVIRGMLDPAARTLQATVRAEDAALAAVAPLVPIDAAVGGRLDATLDVAVRAGTDAPLALTGDLTVHAIRIGPEDSAPVTAEALRVTGLAIEGHTIAADSVMLEAPSIVIERESDGSFPLRAMLSPDGAGAAAPRERDGIERPIELASAARDGGAPTRWQVDIDTIRITDGAVRFIDRVARPFYSEEITRLDVTIRSLSTVDARTAGLTIQGIVGADAALDLRGEMAPFADPFFLEVSGTLRDFSVPRTNPLLRRFLDWVASRGELTTQVHYRIVGNELEATNELVVHRLDVQKAPGDDRAQRLVGLPIGLVISLLKDASGTIRFTLPVSGELGSPQFSFGDAVKSALKNVLGRLVTSPFRAIGSLFRRGDNGDIEELRVKPVTFPAGSAALTPEAARHLQRVADFLRERPFIRLGLEPIVTDEDVSALRAAEVTARIQRVQRQEGMDFAGAARRVWRGSMPAGSEPPLDPQGIVRVLAQREPAPTEAARQLAARRAGVARMHLVDEAGIAKERLPAAPGALAIGAEGDPRVEFSLEPIS